VVSGLARGIDAAAHEGALSAGGSTAAVLGCGLDVCYPPEHRDLARRIAASGALFSEFPAGRCPEPMAFAMRNRIISGMSAAVVVVESASDGGAMITAGFAAEQGRTVFAVPGRIDQPLSAGCHQLIREGATLLTGVDEIFEELSHLPGFNSRTGAPPAIRPLAIAPGARVGLDEGERAVLACFEDGASLAIDAVAGKAGLAPQRVCAALMALELKGFLARGIDGAYELKAQS
jgi:DNA processing protein